MQWTSRLLTLLRVMNISSYHKKNPHHDTAVPAAGVLLVPAFGL